MLGRLCIILCSSLWRHLIPYENFFLRRGHRFVPIGSSIRRHCHGARVRVPERDLDRLASRSLFRHTRPSMTEQSPGGTSRLRATRVAVFTAFFGMGLVFATWASRIPDIKTLLSLDDAQLGTLLIALPLGQLMTMPLSGWLVARWGSHRVAVVGQIGYASALMVLGAISDKTSLTVALLALGSLGNLSSISVNTQGVLAEKVHEKPLMASFHGAWSLAGLTGALIGLAAMQFGVSRFWHCAGIGVGTGDRWPRRVRWVKIIWPF